MHFYILLKYTYDLQYLTPSPLSPLKISGHTLGMIVLTIKVINCSAHSKGSCPVVRDMPFRPEACSATVCPNTSRVSFSLEQLQDLASTNWDLECSVKLCFSEVHVLGA